MRVCVCAQRELRYDLSDFYRRVCDVKTPAIDINLTTRKNRRVVKNFQCQLYQHTNTFENMFGTWPKGVGVQ